MKRIARWLSDGSAAGRTRRSRTGLGLGLVMGPLLLGLMACFVLPVPIGDPERSKVDSALSGVWLGIEEDSAAFLILEPYDKRSWLVSWVFVETTVEAETGSGDAAGGQGDTDLESLIEQERKSAAFPIYRSWLKDGKLSVTGFMPFKGWLTKIKRERFFTWEPKLVLWSDDGMHTDHWWVLRVRVIDEDNIILDYLDPDFEGLNEVESRREAERVLRRNLENPDLYVDGGDVHYWKLPQEDYELLHKLLDDRGISSNFEDL